MNKRGSTHDDRDQFVPKHRTQPRGVPVAIPDEITGQYEGEELREYRSRRATIERIERLEDHKDQSIAMFAAVDSKLGVLVERATKTEEREERREKREHESREADRRRKWVLALIAGIVTAIVSLIGALR